MTARTSLISLLVLSAACTALISCSSTNSDSASNAPKASSPSGQNTSAPADKLVFYPITRAPDAPAAEQKSAAQASAPAAGANFAGGFQGFGGNTPSPFTKAMGDIGQIFGQFEEISKTGWTAAKNAPVPAAEAGRMIEILQKLTTGERAKSKPADFAALMKKTGEQTKTLQDILNAANAGVLGAAGGVDSRQASAQFKLIAATCNECHTKYRD